jgi:hypothetical protein
MEATLGSRDFATAYRNAQTIKLLMEQQDWDALAPFVRLEGAVAKNN